jgi:hypothetical protein
MCAQIYMVHAQDLGRRWRACVRTTLATRGRLSPSPSPVARVVNCGVEFGGVQVGVIGLGNMGAHMATNLIKKGEDVVVFDGNC